MKANIRAQNLVVHGLVEGDVDCGEFVELAETARVTGNIRTARFAVSDGAHFNGQVQMVQAEQAPAANKT